MGQIALSFNASFPSVLCRSSIIHGVILLTSVRSYETQALPKHKYHEPRQRQLTAPAPRFPNEPVEPFEATLAHPAWRARHLPTENVDGTADPHREPHPGRGERLLIALDPQDLARRTVRDTNSRCSGLGNPAERRFIVTQVSGAPGPRRGKVRDATSCAQMLRRSLARFYAATQKEEVRSSRNQFRHSLNDVPAGDALESFGSPGPKQPSGINDPYTIGDPEIGPNNGSPKPPVMPCPNNVLGIEGDQMTAATVPGLRQRRAQPIIDPFSRGNFHWNVEN